MASVSLLVVKNPVLWFNPGRIEGVGIRVGFVGPELVVVLPHCDVVIGRTRPREDTRAFLRISADSVSRRHCMLHFTDPGFELEDLKSTCGTPVNDRKVWPGRVRLRPGDTIRIGRHLFIYDETDAVDLADEPWAGPHPEMDA